MRLWVLTLGFGFVLVLLFLVVNAVVSELTGWHHPLPGALSGGVVVAAIVAVLAWWSNRVLARRAATADAPGGPQAEPLSRPTDLNQNENPGSS